MLRVWSCRLIPETRGAEAPCRPAVRPERRSHHVAYVRGTGRISEDGLPELIGRQAVADRKGKDVDYLVGVRAYQMRSEDAAGIFLDDRLEAGCGFRCLP